MGHKSLTTFCKSQSMRNRWITTICDLIRPRGKSLGGGDLNGRHFVGGHIGFRSNILNGKGVMWYMFYDWNLMENTMVKSVLRYLYFLRSYKHLQVPCLPSHKVLNMGPLLCQASVQSILIRVMNNWVDIYGHIWLLSIYSSCFAIYKGW